MPILLWIIRNPRLVMMALAVIGIAGVAGWLYWKGGSDREERIINKAITEKIEKKERLDEIRNSPVDERDVIKRLRHGSF